MSSVPRVASPYPCRRRTKVLLKVEQPVHSRAIIRTRTLHRPLLANAKTSSSRLAAPRPSSPYIGHSQARLHTGTGRSEGGGTVSDDRPVPEPDTDLEYDL